MVLSPITAGITTLYNTFYDKNGKLVKPMRIARYKRAFYYSEKSITF